MWKTFWLLQKNVNIKIDSYFGFTVCIEYQYSEIRPARALQQIVKPPTEHLYSMFDRQIVVCH